MQTPLYADPPDTDPSGHVTCDTCWEANPPPSVTGMTHRCKNITLPQTSFTGGKDEIEQKKYAVGSLHCLLCVFNIVHGPTNGTASTSKGLSTRKEIQTLPIFQWFQFVLGNRILVQMGPSPIKILLSNTKQENIAVGCVPTSP